MMTEDEITIIVIDTLQRMRASEADWHRFTIESGPYSITRLNIATLNIARAVEAEVRARTLEGVVLARGKEP